MTTDTGTSLTLTRLVQADPEAVFAAFTEPAELEQWFCPEGGTVSDVAVDLTVGGSFQVTMNMPDAPHKASGVYRIIDRPRKLAFTWRWEGNDADEETLVTVELHPRDKATEVVFTHERFASKESRDMHEQGWTSALNRLESLFA